MIPESTVPPVRITALNDATAAPDRAYVLYWMVAYRRPEWNFALQRAAEWARHLGRPLVILEALRVGYRWASDRFHRFALDGMADQGRAFADRPVLYYPYLEPAPGKGSGLLETLAEAACVLVTDDFPCFFLPRMQEAVAPRLAVRVERVDSNGLLPLRAVDKVYPSAYHFRRALQKHLPDHLVALPHPDPTAEDLPDPDTVDLGAVRTRWPEVTPDLLKGTADLGAFPIDHTVAPVAYPGGFRAGRTALDEFLGDGFDRYAERRSHPDADAQSGLSPYLHWGHLSSHEIFHAVAEREGWGPTRLSGETGGKRAGWWGMDPNAESFLDELITWRELGFNMTSRTSDYDRYDSLPGWARETLEEHADDPRPALYSLERLERADTEDELWNAAQRQLLREGRIHNYMRMLWGKKILEWTEHPTDALRIMIHLNNKYSVDGRNPNSYSGIFWCLGRYDRPWQERPVFGKVRSMTSPSARRKLDLDGYLGRFGPGEQGELFDGRP